MNNINQNSQPVMSKFLTDRGWTFAGNCGCSANLNRWIHVEHPEWKIETKGNNTLMSFKKQVNPLNLTDFRAMVHASMANYVTEYDKIFPKVEPPINKPQ